MHEFEVVHRGENFGPCMFRKELIHVPFMPVQYLHIFHGTESVLRIYNLTNYRRGMRSS
jgi:hypothetical protein